MGESAAFIRQTAPTFDLRACVLQYLWLLCFRKTRLHSTCKNQSLNRNFVWQIFTEDLPEVESLPRDKVLNFLIESFKSLAIPYLVRTYIENSAANLTYVFIKPLLLSVRIWNFVKNTKFSMRWNKQNIQLLGGGSEWDSGAIFGIPKWWSVEKSVELLLDCTDSLSEGRGSFFSFWWALELCVYSQEHIIHVWEETGSEFHNCLIQLYCEKVQGLMKEYLCSFPAGTSNHDLPCLATGSDTGRGDCRAHWLDVVLEVSWKCRGEMDLNPSSGPSSLLRQDHVYLDHPVRQVFV